MNPSCSFMGISRISKENQCIFHENIQLKKVSEIEILGGRRFLASWHDDRGRFRSDLSRSETSMDIFVSHLTSDLTLDITSDPLHFFTDPDGHLRPRGREGRSTELGGISFFKPHKDTRTLDRGHTLGIMRLKWTSPSRCILPSGVIYWDLHSSSQTFVSVNSLHIYLYLLYFTAA